METKPLLFGLIGFFLGGLIVSIAATTFDKPNIEKEGGAAMSQMTESLKGKQGDEFDKAFITEMMVHHQGAIDMAKLAVSNAKHNEIRNMSHEIISAQEAEIVELQRWEVEWDYNTNAVMDTNHNGH